jgi:tetratricopeptide (TPR) repeat protein
MHRVALRLVQTAAILMVFAGPAVATGTDLPGNEAATAVPVAPAAPGARYFEAGRALLARGETRTGFEALTVAVVLAPGNVAYQTYLLASLDRNEHNWDVPLHEALHAVAPAYPPLLQRLGKLYDGKARYADAEALYLQWAHMRPNQPEPHARLGEHYFFLGRYDDAIRAWDRHRTLMGESDYALRRMATAHEALGHHDQADRLMAKANMLAPPPQTGVRVAETMTLTR